jgi:hypothetical protein
MIGRVAESITMTTSRLRAIRPSKTGGTTSWNLIENAFTEVSTKKS